MEGWEGCVSFVDLCGSFFGRIFEWICFFSEFAKCRFLGTNISQGPKALLKMMMFPFAPAGIGFLVPCKGIMFQGRNAWTSKNELFLCADFGYHKSRFLSETHSDFGHYKWLLHRVSFHPLLSSPQH